VDLLIVELTKVIMSIVVYHQHCKADVLTNVDREFFLQSAH